MAFVNTAFAEWLPKNNVNSVKNYLDSLGVIETTFLQGKSLRNAVPERTHELLAQIQSHPGLIESRKKDLSAALRKFDDFKRDSKGLPPRAE